MRKEGGFRFENFQFFKNFKKCKNFFKKMSRTQQRAIIEQLCSLVNKEPPSDSEIQREINRDRRNGRRDRNLKIIREEKLYREESEKAIPMEKEVVQEENIGASFRLCRSTLVFNLRMKSLQNPVGAMGLAPSEF